MAKNNELIRLAKKAADAWRNTDGYQQAAQIIDMLVEELESDAITQPNEPLTLEELREMDGEPVWFDTIKRWGIVRVCGYGISVLTKSGEYDVTRMKFYRLPTEGEEET